MGSGSSVSAPENNLPAHSSSRQLLSRLSQLQLPENKDGSHQSLNTISRFAPSRADTEEGDGGKRTFQLGHDLSRLNLNVQSRSRSLLSECPLLTEAQESKIKSCLTSLEKLLKESQLQFDAESILAHAVIVHEDGGKEETQLLDRVGEGLFVIDSGTVDLMSPSSGPTEHVQIIQLSEGDYCGEYSTLFNVPFRIKVQFKSSVDLLHLPADVVRLNMHCSGQLDREAMLHLSIIQSNLLSGSLFGEDICNKVVANCLKASLFSGLSDKALNFLAGTVTPLLFSSGEVVYNEGETATYVFLVLKGTVQLMRQGQLHRAHKVTLSSEGVSIAANEFFGGTILSHQAMAGGPLLLAAIGREQILDMLNKFPDCVEAAKKIVQRR